MRFQHRHTAGLTITPVERRSLVERGREATLSQGFSLDAAAAAIGTSKRTLARRLHAPCWGGHRSRIFRSTR